MHVESFSFDRPMHVGKHIKEIVEKQGRRPSWLARQLHTVRPNVYNIYRRESLDSELLQRLSVILGHNFLKDLAQETEQQMKNES